MERISDDELNAYVDGGLDIHDVRRVEAALAEDADAREQVAIYRAQRAAFAGYLDAVVGEPAPRTERLATQLGDRLAARPRQSWVGRVAAGFLLLAVGWQAHALAAKAGPFLDRLMVPRYVEEAAAAHTTLHDLRAWYPLLSLERGMDVARAMGWSGFDRDPGRLEHVGTFVLMGVALVPWDRGSALELVYTDAADSTVTVFVAADDVERMSEMDRVELDSRNFVYWQQDGFDYVVGGALPPETLTLFARSLASRFG